MHGDCSYVSRGGEEIPIVGVQGALAVHTEWTSQSGKFASKFDQVDQLLDRGGKSRNALTRIVDGGYDALGTNTVTLHTWVDIKDVSEHFFRSCAHETRQISRPKHKT